MKILVTGFDPFGKDVVNPSIEAVKRLPDIIGDAEIVKLEIPTKFGESAFLVQRKIKEITPEYVLHIGQAGGRSQISPERVAINIDDAAIADNAGNQPIDQPIKADGAVAYFSSLPLKAMVKYMQDEDIPASISNTAGTFVCNHIMYQTLHYTAQEFPDMKSGFIHIPFITEQVKDRPNVPSMDLDSIVKGLVASIQAIVDFHTKDDLKVIGGKTH